SSGHARHILDYDVQLRFLARAWLLIRKIFFIAARAVMSGMIACLFVTPTWSNKVLTSVDKEDLKERIENLSSPIDLRYSAEVHHIVDSYIRHARKSSERLLGLSEQYFPVYEHILSDQGIPTELKYLSVVESGLRPTIESHVGAVGMWQFMSETAKFYGLTVNSTVDERRDVIRSTEAASIYLRDLYHQFGDWTLAIAAYNCGPGKLKRVLRRYPNQEFWHVRGGLPKETRTDAVLVAFSAATGVSPWMCQ
ncbi:MAG: lytic transglycosylase domain-containing protein, partial [Bacteroidota bacterium]